MSRSRSDSLRRVVLRPAPYVLAATIVGTAVLANFDPKPTVDGVDDLAPTSAGGPAPTSASAPITTNEEIRASQRGAVPYLPGRPRTVLGSLANIGGEHPFGRIQVKITVESGRIIDAEVVRVESYYLPAKTIADYAVPVLLQRTLVSGSAAYEQVSSATYTSRGYAASVQAAIKNLPTPEEAAADLGGNAAVVS